jgi:hypothetical protein
MSYEHTEECKRKTSEREALRARYGQEWPAHCLHCEGWGVFAVSVSLSSGLLTELVPCPECVERGRCPRCAQETLSEENEYGHCSACGWTSGAEGISEGMPPVYECTCYEPDEWWELQGVG